MRRFSVLATLMFVTAIFSTIHTNVYENQEIEDIELLLALGKNPKSSNYSVNTSTGWTSGGEEIIITGTGFLDMAFKNLTHDGNAYTWTTMTANYVTSSGWDPTIGVDSNGTVHIVSSNMNSDDLWHSSFDGSTWAHAKIRNCDVCSNADLVIDSNDNIHIAYFHSISTSGYLLYSMYDGTSWTNNWSKSNVENDQISIALDANDQPHISYSREGYLCNAALLSYYDGSSWATVTLDDSSTYIGCDSSIAIDSNGFVHVAYRNHNNMDMMIASNISGSWQRYTVDNGAGVGYHSAMAVDSNDDLHIVYATNAAGNTVYYAEGASGSAWTVSAEGNSRNTFSMYIDQYDIVHISEYKGNTDLGYSMTAPGGTRQSMTIDYVGDVGYGNDIVVDDNNMVHVAYYDSSNKLLKYANRSTGMFMSQEISVQFGSYGSVTGTVVNDTTIRVTTPVAGSVAEQVDLKLFGDQGSTIDLGIVFQYISPDDVDMDGVLNGGDDCPNQAGTSTIDSIGCPDLDSDGYSDAVDAFPSEPSQWSDTDGDGYGDDENGSNGDAFPLDSSQWSDADGDGYGDNPSGNQSDTCPSENGNSTIGSLGCPDNDGDGVSNAEDAFPDDPTETEDSDGDGVGDNLDVFPLDVGEHIDSDGDGVGDNSDALPNDPSETKDSDGDGIGDNSDSHPFINNNLDTDADGHLNTVDAFPNDQTQWSDTDGDGYGDNEFGNNSDAFVNESTQWADSDGDGYGDNWGDSSWNTTRLFIWPGQFIDGAAGADHCPTEIGNSSSNGFFGCLDADGDGIADIYDNETEPQVETNESDVINETEVLDTDLDGVPDTVDVCPGSTIGTYVDEKGCIIDSDMDGIDDLKDICPNTTFGVQVTVEGCELSALESENEDDSFIDSLLSGGSDNIRSTVGIGAILLALLAVLQTNFAAAILPDAFRWVQVLRRSNKLSKEEQNELTYLQSLVQAYFTDMSMLSEELLQMSADLTARYTNNEITKDTREKLNTLIEDLLSFSPQQIERIAYNDAYFGLIGTTDTAERTELLQQELAMREGPATIEPFSIDKAENYTPDSTLQGNVNAQDGYEYLEFPASSGNWFVRNKATNEWQKWA